jgi:hypothetical protein
MSLPAGLSVEENLETLCARLFLHNNLGMLRTVLRFARLFLCAALCLPLPAALPSAVPAVSAFGATVSMSGFTARAS